MEATAAASVTTTEIFSLNRQIVISGKFTEIPACVLQLLMKSMLFNVAEGEALLTVSLIHCQRPGRRGIIERRRKLVYLRIKKSSMYILTQRKSETGIRNRSSAILSCTRDGRSSLFRVSSDKGESPTYRKLDPTVPWREHHQH